MKVVEKERSVTGSAEWAGRKSEGIQEKLTDGTWESECSKKEK